MNKLIYILIFTIGINFTSSAQNNNRAESATQAKLINFYPNPATSVINFDFLRSYEKTHTLLIFNFMGKQVADIKNLSQRTNLQLDDFFRGIYIFQLRDKNGTILQTGKFQVVK